MKAKLTSIRTQLTTLHDEPRTCAMTGPVPAKKMFWLSWKSPIESTITLPFANYETLLVLLGGRT